MVVGDTPQVPRVENQTPTTLRVEPIAPQIHIPEKERYHNDDNDDTVNFTGRSNDVAPPPNL